MAFIITNVSNPFPNVANESDRDTQYPTPTDGQQVFNKRINLVQTYNSTFGLWLDANTRVMTVSQLLNTKRVVYISGSYTVSGIQYPIALYPTSRAANRLIQGAITQIGNNIVGTRYYVAVAVKGLYYIDYASGVTVGNYLSARVGSGGNTGTVWASSGTGVFGHAYENSGANPNEPNSVLVNIGLTTEIF